MRSKFTRLLLSPSICLALLIAVPTVALMQRRPPPSTAPRPVSWWWPPQKGGAAEQGQIKEIKDKRRVYVSYFVYTSEREAKEIQEHVVKAFASYGELEVVNTIEQADFAVNVSATKMPLANPQLTGREPQPTLAPPAHLGEPDWPTTMEVSVLVRGAALPDGANRARIVWHNSQTVWDQAGAAAGSGVRRFIKDYKKARVE